MHDLCAQAFVIAFEPQAGGWLAQPCLRRGDGVIEHLRRQPVRLVDDHHPPVQLVPVSADEILHVVRPPEAFERRLHEVLPHALPGDALDGVDCREQPLHGVVERRAIRGAAPIDHDESHFRHVHQDEVLRRRQITGDLAQVCGCPRRERSASGVVRFGVLSATSRDAVREPCSPRPRLMGRRGESRLVPGVKGSVRRPLWSNGRSCADWLGQPPGEALGLSRLAKQSVHLVEQVPSRLPGRRQLPRRARQSARSASSSRCSSSTCRTCSFERGHRRRPQKRFHILGS